MCFLSMFWKKLISQIPTFANVHCAIFIYMWCDLMKALLNLFVESAANDQATYSEGNMSDVNRTATSEQSWRRKEPTPRRKRSTQAKQLTERNKNALARVTLQENKITPNRAICDGENDCDDNSDGIGCQCPGDMFKSDCYQSDDGCVGWWGCIGQSRACSDKYDCSDKSDEEMCDCPSHKPCECDCYRSEDGCAGFWDA